MSIEPIKNNAIPSATATNTKVEKKYKLPAEIKDEFILESLNKDTPEDSKKKKTKITSIILAIGAIAAIIVLFRSNKKAPSKVLPEIKNKSHSKEIVPQDIKDIINKPMTQVMKMYSEMAQKNPTKMKFNADFNAKKGMPIKAVIEDKQNKQLITLEYKEKSTYTSSSLDYYLNHTIIQKKDNSSSTGYSTLKDLYINEHGNLIS